MVEKKQNKVQTVVTDYQFYVLHGLSQIQGRTISNVLHHIITSYIEEKTELLESTELTVRHWKEARKNE